ncbi:MAG: hypothetical protein ACRD0K_14650 [Egibacteraceae bacterium]
MKALVATRALAAREGIFAGVSTGAALSRRAAGLHPAPPARGLEGRRDQSRRRLEVPLDRRLPPGDVEQIAQRIPNTLWA